jgi:hypothetical protein
MYLPCNLTEISAHATFSKVKQEMYENSSRLTTTSVPTVMAHVKKKINFTVRTNFGKR